MIVIVRAVQTSMACPSQWDAWDADGNYYYLRYRHGWGEVTQYQSEDWMHAPWKPDEEIDKTQPGWGRTANTAYIRTITEFQHGDPLDGSITLEEFAGHAGIRLALDAAVTGFGDHLRDELIMDGILPPDV